MSGIIIFAISIVAIIAVKIVNDNRHFDINYLTINQKWVFQCFKKCAKRMVYEEYISKGKNIFTKKGKYRVAYLNDVNKKRSELIQECCNGTYFNSNFCNFVQLEYPDIKVKNLQEAINNFRKYMNKNMQKKLNDFLLNVNNIIPEEFFKIKKRQTGDIVGVYIIHNETKDMYYVGQAKKLFFRINQHFTGHGNGDVYADYKYGDNFIIKIVKLSDSGYDDLDLLEKDLIKKYNAFSNGYNKTVGNN